MPWSLIRHIVDPRVDALHPPILLGKGGSPNGVQTAPKGALACVRDGASSDLLWYLNTDGGTTWVVAFKPLALAWYSGTVSAPAADSAAGVAAREEDNVAGKAWVGPFTSPVAPRNVTVTFESAWAGGDVTVAGTDQFDAAQTEVIADVAGSLVAGTKVFKTVTAATNQLTGAGGVNHGATLGWGHKFGIAKVLALALGHLTVDGVDDPATWDATRHSFVPTQLPDGARTYRWAVPT